MQLLPALQNWRVLLNRGSDSKDLFKDLWWNYKLLREVCRVNAVASNTDISFYGLLTFIHEQIPTILSLNGGVWTVNGGIQI